MINFLQNTGDLANTFGFIVFSAVVAFAWSPFLIALLYRFRLAKTPKQELTVIAAAKKKTSSGNGRPLGHCHHRRPHLSLRLVARVYLGTNRRHANIRFPRRHRRHHEYLWP